MFLVRGAWNSAFLDELCAFPGHGSDDQVDAAAGAFNKLTSVQTPIAITAKMVQQVMHARPARRRY